MSREEAGAAGPAVPVPLAARIVIAFALLGLLAGFLWGVADVPRYTATAGVVVPPDGGEEVDRAELARVAARGESERVATAAAGLLGGDVAGGDLLSDVVVVPAPRRGGVVVRATADAPDIAAATADGYVEAIVEEGGDRLELGAAAAVPEEPSENRSATRSSAIGLAAGLLAGGLLALLAGRRRAAPRERPPAEPAPVPAPGEERGLEAAFGAPVLRAPLDPARLVSRSPGGRLSLDPAGASAVVLLVDELEIDARAAPSRIAVLGASAGAGTAELATALAIAAAELGLTVIAIDADVASPAVAAIAGVDAAPGLADYLEGDAGPRDVLRAVPLAGGRSIVCLPAGEPRSRTAEEIDGPRLAALLDRLPRVYDLVVVAGPPASGDAAAALADRTDGAVLIARRGEPADRVAAASRRLGDGRVLVGVEAGEGSPQAPAQAALPNA